jgi:hypothetical protein
VVTVNRHLTVAAMTLMPGLVGACDMPGHPSPMPAWQTDSTHCQWDWLQGGGIGFWAESCQLASGLWRIRWDSARGAFVQTLDHENLAIVVQPWPLDTGSNIAALSEALVAQAALEPEAPCRWETMVLHGAPETMLMYTLSPVDELATGMSPQGEVPEPVCGAYGRSTHGVRYFITDLRWPDLAVFVDEGQERPLFEPRSISIVP